MGRKVKGEGLGCWCLRALTQTSQVPSGRGQRGAAGALSCREREVEEESRRDGEEERRQCLKRAVEINQYVYVLEEQSVPLAEEHSTVRFPSDCFYRTR